jgi:hypothetical protein
MRFGVLFCGVLFVSACTRRIPTALMADQRGHVQFTQAKRSFDADRYSKHAVLFSVPGLLQDSCSWAATDSLRIMRDSLFVRICDAKDKRCTAGLFLPGERFELSNRAYWLIIPVSRVHFIKSRRKLLARTTVALTALAYASVVAAPFLGPRGPENEFPPYAEKMMLIGLPVLFTSYAVNVFVAKKRFRMSACPCSNPGFVLL